MNHVNWQCISKLYPETLMRRNTDMKTTRFHKVWRAELLFLRLSSFPQRVSCLLLEQNKSAKQWFQISGRFTGNWMKMHWNEKEKICILDFMWNIPLHFFVFFQLPSTYDLHLRILPSSSATKPHFSCEATQRRRVKWAQRPGIYSIGFRLTGDSLQS